MSTNEELDFLRFETLRQRVFCAAKDGLVLTLHELLSEASPRLQTEILGQV